MSNTAAKPTPAYPGHSWGPLAKDPFRQIGSQSEEHRQVLRRYWLRNGGDGKFFDQLMPPVEEKPGAKAP